MTDEKKKTDDEAEKSTGKLPPSGLAKDILARYESAGAAGAAGSTAAAKGGTADKATPDRAAEAGASPAAEAAGDGEPRTTSPATARSGVESGAAPGAEPDGREGVYEEEDLSTPERVYAFTDSLEAAAEEEALKETPETHVTFYLADEIFTLPVTNVQEVVRVTGITRVPHAPFPVRGITTLRGQILPVVDLRLRLGLPETDTTELSRILVLQSRGRRIGLLVDRVREVVRLLPSQVQSPPADVMTEQSEYILGVYPYAESLLILLDLDKVLLIPDSLEASRAQGRGRDPRGRSGGPVPESPRRRRAEK